MRDIYLLAAGLLTGVVVPASTVPQLSIIQAENTGILWNLKDSIQRPTNEKTVPSIDSSIPFIPEFSNQELLNPVASSFNFNTQLSYTNRPISGRQLYHQRLVELKSGQINASPDKNIESLSVASHKSQPTYEDWKSLLLTEAKAMAQEQGENSLGIIIGDSLSLWFPKEKLPTDRLWLNQGISGDTSGGILKRLSAFSTTKPDVIYIMVGINDLRKGMKDETILHNHRTMIRRLQQAHPQAQILVQSILPTRLAKISNNRIRYINHHLDIIAREEGAYYLNLYQWFIDFQGNLREELTTDGLHLSSEGYEVWHSAMQEVEFKFNRTRVINNSRVR